MLRRMTHCRFPWIAILPLLVATMAACAAIASGSTPRAAPQGAVQSDTSASSTVVKPVSKATSSATPFSTSIPIAEGLSAVSFRIPLTVRHVTDTTVEFFFELSSPAEGRLIYHSAQDGAGQQAARLDPTRSSGSVSITGLSPGATYQASLIVQDCDGQYRQPGFGGATWGEVTFSTWSGRQPLTFGLIGDSGFGDAVTPQLTRQMAASGLDFAIQAGDVVYNVFDNADPFEAFAVKYFQPFSPLLHQMPVYTVIGNHDVERAAMWEGMPFYDHVFPAFYDPRIEQSTYNGRNEWYAFAYGPVQFIMLNTEAFEHQDSRADQKAWLAERLADRRFSLSVPVFHIPPYSAGLHPSDGLGVRSDWQPLFEQAGVRLILSGHDHNYQRLMVRGITYIISGGGSATLYQEGQALPESQVFARRSHFVVFQVFPDRIDLQAVALGGDIIDQTTIPLN
jgi:predicted phosphodiesterase